ncbi:MAG: CHAT domain-containing protein [bacterium]
MMTCRPPSSPRWTPSTSRTSSDRMADPVTILFLGANPDGSARLRLDREVREIRRALEQTALRERFRLETLWASSFEDLLDGLLRHAPAVVHFSGHGRPDALLFEGPDGKAAAVSVEALSRLFGALTGQVRLVVFNACDSLKAAQAVAPFVECAVGTTEPVGDRGAAAFAAAFYRGVGYGRTIAEAAELGRSAILAAGLSGADDLVLAPRAGIDPSRLVLIASDRGRPIDPKVLDSTPIELTIHLVREGDQVRVRYVHDGRPLPGHEPGGGGLMTPAPAPAPGTAIAGNTMFSLLFPDPLARVELMRTLTGAAVQPSPDRYRWRIRVRTDDPALLRWPWARTAWEGQPLAAGARPWTFEVASEEVPRLVASLPAGGRVLAYAPPDRVADVERLQAALAAGAGAYGRDGFQLARSADELRDAWRARPAAALVVGADPGVGPMMAVHCPTLLYVAGFDGAELAARAPSPWWIRGRSRARGWRRPCRSGSRWSWPGPIPWRWPTPPAVASCRCTPVRALAGQRGAGHAGLAPPAPPARPRGAARPGVRAGAEAGGEPCAPGRRRGGHRAARPRGAGAQRAAGGPLQATRPRPVSRAAAAGGLPRRPRAPAGRAGAAAARRPQARSGGAAARQPRRRRPPAAGGHGPRALAGLGRLRQRTWPGAPSAHPGPARLALALRGGGGRAEPARPLGVLHPGRRDRAPRPGRGRGRRPRPGVPRALRVVCAAAADPCDAARAAGLLQRPRQHGHRSRPRGPGRQRAVPRHGRRLRHPAREHRAGRAAGLEAPHRRPGPGAAPPRRGDELL